MHMPDAWRLDLRGFIAKTVFDCRHRGGQGGVKTAVTPYVGAKKHTRQHGSNSAGNGNGGCQC
jgi:hypothetical protein